MAESKIVQDAFYTYILTQMPAVQLSNIDLMLYEIERFCLERKILKKALFETTERNVIEQVVQTVDSNRVFKFTYRGNLEIMSMAIHAYYTFLEGYQSSNRESEEIQNNGKNMNVPVDYHIVDFSNIQRMAYTKPISFSYVSSCHKAVTNWTKLYIEIMNCLVDDYPNILDPRKISHFGRSRRIDYAFGDKANRMTAPKKLKNGCCLETNHSATDIIKKIRIVLQTCNVDFKTVEIRYCITGGTTMAVPDKQKIDPNSVTSNTNDWLDGKRVNFYENTSYAFTQPTKFSYFDEVITQVSTWTQLYVQVIKCLLEDYPDVLHSYINKNIDGQRRIDFADENGMLSMATPKEVTSNFYLETNINATTIVAKIKRLLDLCNVDYENLEVYYKKKNGNEFQISPIQMKENQIANLEIESDQFAVSKLLPKREEPFSESKIVVPIIEKMDLQSTKSDLKEFLKDDLYAPLLQELMRKGITTVQELKQLKLWPFMNRYNLYSIATRQAVLEKIQEKLMFANTLESNRQFILTFGNKEYKGQTASETYFLFCEEIARQYPLKFRSLIGRSISPDGSIAVSRVSGNRKSLKMTNPVAYIDADLSMEEISVRVSWIGNMCIGNSTTIRIKEPTDDIVKVKPTLKHKSTELVLHKAKHLMGDNSSQSPVLSNDDQCMIKRMEQFVLNFDLEGVGFNEVKDELNVTMVKVKSFAKQTNHLVEIKERLYHEEAFVDWNEGADQLESILEKLMQKNNGYVSITQLYDYARSDMHMFLNDNDIDDERSVYDIAQHLFEKEHYHGKKYVFNNKKHISSTMADICSNFDIYCKFAEEQDGIFSYDAMVDYLKCIGISTGNLSGQLKLYNEPYFFYYKSGVLIYAKSMNINAKWKSCVKRAFERLFADVGNYIILREIQPIWFEQLPELPSGRKWTPVLLQNILRFWSEELGARTISAMDTQWLDTLHAMLVQLDSPIQNFGDAVISYLLENDIEQRSFEAEELRMLLLKSQMIQGNELHGNMPKALSGDERFSWNASGNKVTILI